MPVLRRVSGSIGRKRHTMAQEWYYGSGEADETERSRLELLEKIDDPNMIRRLEMLGVAESWNCLEVSGQPIKKKEWQ
jgi:hypothetical protein